MPIFRANMMNTQAANTKAINWNRVSRVTFRFAWAVTVLAFKLVLIALSFVIGLFTSNKDEAEEHDDSDVGFVDAFDAKYNKYTHTDSYNILRKDKTRF
jgi:hypothetical protein